MKYEINKLRFPRYRSQLIEASKKMFEVEDMQPVRRLKL